MTINQKLPALIVGLALLTTTAFAAPNPATDTRIDPQVRAFLDKINKDSSEFWRDPQPKPQDIFTALQDATAVDMSGVTITDRMIDQDGQKVKIYIMKPDHPAAKPGVRNPALGQGAATFGPGLGHA